MPKGSLTTQYIGGIVADQLSKMAATIIGSSLISDLEIMISGMSVFTATYCRQETSGTSFKMFSMLQ